MLMPTNVDSSLQSLTSGGPASTVLTPTSIANLPTVTTTIQTMQSKDTTWTKLFVGGLPYHTTDKSLREHFEVFGDIEEAVVITDRTTGKSRGYGFVIMSTKDSAERACKEPNPIIDGRKANVNLAILGAKPRGNLTASLPLPTLRQGFPTILPAQYGDLLAGGQIGLSGAGYTAAAGPGSGASTAVSLQAAAAAQAAGPGKARSSMNLGLISGRQAVPGGAGGSPYLQQLYAAQAPYMHPNLLSLTGLGTDPYSGNPLLDFYGQYAAAAAAASGFPQVTQAQFPTVTQTMVPSIQSNGIDSHNAAALAAGGYFGYAYSPFTAQQLAAAGLTAAGLPYAATAAQSPAAAGAQQPGQADARIQ